MRSLYAYLLLFPLVGCLGDADVDSTQQAACNCDAYPEPCCCTTPILLDIAGDGFRLTSWADGVVFAQSPAYRPSERAWTEPNSDDAWLVLDWNRDGIINDGSEMFGDHTPQPPPPNGQRRNGFAALAQWDNGDDTIDGNDEVFASLRLWQDRNHDAQSQPEELHSLTELGVAAISVVYSEVRQADEHGNAFRYRSAVLGSKDSGVGMTAWDVLLTGVQPELAVEHLSFTEPRETAYLDGYNEQFFNDCIDAAHGDYDDWLDFCNFIPTQEGWRASCRNVAFDINPQVRVNWCLAFFDPPPPPTCLSVSSEDSGP